MPVKAKVKNNSRASQGVHTVDNHIWIAPGDEREAVFSDDQIEQMKSRELLAVKAGESVKERDPLDHDDDGKKGGAVSVPDLVESASEANPAFGARVQEALDEKDAREVAGAARGEASDVRVPVTPEKRGPGRPKKAGK